MADHIGSPPPKVGEIYRGRGGEREVVEVLRVGDLFEVVWRRPGKAATSRAWYQTWKDWMRTAEPVGANPLATIPDPARFVAAVEKARTALNIAPWTFETEHAELLSCVVCGGTEIEGHVNACIVGEALRALALETEEE